MSIIDDILKGTVSFSDLSEGSRSSRVKKTLKSLAKGAAVAGAAAALAHRRGTVVSRKAGVKNTDHASKIALGATSLGRKAKKTANKVAGDEYRRAKKSFSNAAKRGLRKRR